MDLLDFRIFFFVLMVINLASADLHPLEGQLGSTCTKDKHCKVENSLCLTGVCGCKRYHATVGTTECLEAKLLGRDCKVNAQCFLRVANSTCIDGHCHCTPGFVKFRKHTCLGPAKPGEVCYSDEHCQLWNRFSHCQFLIRSLFGKCVCDKGDCKLFQGGNELQGMYPIGSNSTFRPHNDKANFTNGGVETTLHVNEYPPKDEKEPEKPSSQFVDPFQHQKEHLQKTSPVPPPQEDITEGEAATTVVPDTDDTRMEAETTESDVEAMLTETPDAPPEGSKYRVEAGVSVPDAINVTAVSLGYPCRLDAQCQKRDNHSRCLNGVCDCVMKTNGTNACGSRNTGCGPETFQCRESGACISWFFVCDGRADCSDGSDEECRGPKCAETSFRCGESEICVSRAVLCDGVKNCPNGEDERFCRPDERNSTQGCPEHTFRCTDGRCLPKFEFCNAVPRCSDGSDESPYLCTAQPLGRKVAKRRDNCPFECSNGRCRSTAIVCSGRDGCGDNSDEASCYVCRCPAIPTAN